MPTTTTTAPPASVATGGYLTTAELGKNLRRSPQTIRAFVANEGLPAHRINNRLYFDPAEVDAWLRARSGQTDPPSDPYRAAIKRLVDKAPPLTADQAAKIRAVLMGGAA